MMVDGVAPREIAEPGDGEAFAAALAAASRDRRHTVIVGGGTKIGWGRPPASVDLAISTARLNALVVHRHGDLTATVQSGITLAALNRALRSQHQWLPVESAFDGATIGGIVSTNDSGPSRHRNGTPRDLVIGITLAMTDGRLIKAGGTVVKNVAGYDLGKLISGSHGSLAGIVDVTFKLVPLPAASATLVVRHTRPEALAADVAALAGSQVEPAAFDVNAEGGQYALLLRVATSPAATDAQIAAARAMVSGDASVLTGDEERAAWQRQLRSPWEGDAASPDPSTSLRVAPSLSRGERAPRVEAVMRFSWLPANLPAVLRIINDLHRTGTPASLVARAMGTGFLRLGGDPESQAAAAAVLRSSATVGNAVILRASHALKTAVDVWGTRESDGVARAFKQMFDPAGVLNAGRGPV